MSYSILIVDDEQNVLQAIKRCLRREDYDIYLANGGEDALRIMSEKEIALIICDQRMPGMSGAEVLAESVTLRPDAYRITLTGYTDLDAAQKSINEEQVQQRTEELLGQNEKLIKLRGTLENSLRDTVGVLAGTLEMASPAMGIHSKRVGEFARELGSLLEVDEQILRDVEFAAYLHDIGKIIGLQAKQRGYARSSSSFRRLPFAEAGYTLLARVHDFETIAEGIRHQNEKYDGSGSPCVRCTENVPAQKVEAV